MVGKMRALEAPKEGAQAITEGRLTVFCRMLCRKQDEGWQGAADLWSGMGGVGTVGVPTSILIDAVLPFPAVLSFLHMHAIIKIIYHTIMISE